MSRIAIVLNIPAEALQSPPVRETPAPSIPYYEAMLVEKDVQISRLLEEVIFLRRQLDGNRGHDNRGYPDGPGPLYTA